jgi:hypothetical protein
MYITKAKNILNNREYQASFETLEEAKAWLEKKIKNETFGRNARQAVKGDGSYDESLVESEFEVTDEFDETRIMVILRPEYNYVEPVLIDGSGETKEDKQLRMQKAQERAARQKTHTDFGAMIQLYFADLINERNYTQDQKDQIQSDIEVLQILSELNFGRIAKAKKMVDNKKADDSLFYIDDLHQVSILMKDFLDDYPLQR